MRDFRTPRLAVAAMFFLNGALFGAWASRIPAIKLSFGLEPDTLGLLLLLLAGGAIVSFPLAGKLSDRIGAVTVTRRIAWAYALALICISIAPNVWLLGCAIFFFGATHGGMDIAMNAWGAEVERQLRRPIMSSLHAVFSIGAGVGAGCGALAASSRLGVDLHFIGFAGILAVCCGWLARVPWTSSTGEAGHGGHLFSIPKGALLLIGIVAFCASLGEGAMADWSAVYLVAVISASEGQAAIGYAFFSVAMVVMRLSGGRIIMLLGEAMAARLSGCFATAGTCIAIFGGSLTAALAGFSLMGVGFALIMPLAFSSAANDPDHSPGAAIAGVATLGYGGMLLGPPVIGFVADATSFPMAFGVIAALSFVVALFGGFLKKRN
jgi:MFS family permease